MALPVDPLEFLSQKWGLPKLNIYEERWEVTNLEAISYLRQQFALSVRRRDGGEAHWHYDDDGEMHLAIVLLHFSYKPELSCSRI